MTIEEIFKIENDSDRITELKSRRYIPQPDINKAQKALDQDLHDIADPVLRPDKRVRVDADNEAESAKKVVDTNGESTSYKIEKVARIKLSLQKLIIKRAVSFCFGNPILYNAAPETEQQEMIVKALNRILRDNKTNSLNRKIGRSVFGFKECAELWYPVKSSHSNYGFNSKFKLRCRLFLPKNGDVLYPYFDETGDMTAFSRAFTQVEADGRSINYFETYTDTEYWMWILGANGYEVVEGYPKTVAIGKIPVVYGHQPEFETEDVDSLIDRLEKLLSNFADTNDYHASPKIFVTGQINGWAKKGESGAVIEGDEGATMNYVSWQSAPESVKLEIATLLNMIYTISQTPDISFDSVKGLGTISGVALKLLFMDAHLKVQDKKEIFDDYLQRRVNVIKAYIGQFDLALKTECDNIDIEPEIVPYMLTSEIDELNYWMTANGNKPVISQEESVAKSGVSTNPQDTFSKIQEESSRANTFNLGEPVES